MSFQKHVGEAVAIKLASFMDEYISSNRPSLQRYKERILQNERDLYEEMAVPEQAPTEADPSLVKDYLHGWLDNPFDSSEDSKLSPMLGAGFGAGMMGVPTALLAPRALHLNRILPVLMGGLGAHAGYSAFKRGNEVVDQTIETSKNYPTFEDRANFIDSQLEHVLNRWK